MTIDELAEQIDGLGVKLGLEPIPRLVLISEMLKLVCAYQAGVYADVLERIGPGCLEESEKIPQMLPSERLEKLRRLARDF